MKTARNSVHPSSTSRGECASRACLRRRCTRGGNTTEKGGWRERGEMRDMRAILGDCRRRRPLRLGFPLRAQAINPHVAEVLPNRGWVRNLPVHGAEHCVGVIACRVAGYLRCRGRWLLDYVSARVEVGPRERSRTGPRAAAGTEPRRA